MLKWDLSKRSTQMLGIIKKPEATSLLNTVTSFEFIICLIGLYRLLHQLAGITNCLQGRGVDIIEAYDDVSSVIKGIKSTRKNIDKELSMAFEQAERVASFFTCLTCSHFFTCLHFMHILIKLTQINKLTCDCLSFIFVIIEFNHLSMSIKYFHFYKIRVIFIMHDFFFFEAKSINYFYVKENT